MYNTRFSGKKKMKQKSKKQKRSCSNEGSKDILAPALHVINGTSPHVAVLLMDSQAFAVSPKSKQR